jgi:hypothetical protein
MCQRNPAVIFIYPIVNEGTMQPEYNIEFAHIYADEDFGKEQIKSMEILKHVLVRLQKEKKTYVISILIDEFHPTRCTIDEESIVEVCKRNGIAIDFIGYESKLDKVANKVIKGLPRPLLTIEHFHQPEKEVLVLQEHHEHIGLTEHVKCTYRHTCAVLSASWTLCRLGKFSTPPNAIRRLTNKQFTAKNVITILPEKYRAVEDKVLEIINTTKDKCLIKKIEYEFFTM